VNVPAAVALLEHARIVYGAAMVRVISWGQLAMAPMSFPLWFGEPPDAAPRGGDDSSGWAGRVRSRARDSLETPSDETLFTRMRAGDEEALAVLYRRYGVALHRVAQSVVQSRDVASDVVQTVFVRVWERRTDVAVPDRVVGYLHRAVYNAARDAIRETRRERHRRDRSVWDDARRAATSSPDHAVAEEELTRAVHTAIAELPGRSGEIFRLWWQGELTYAQIAEMTEISVKGVEQARARALGRLREALRGYWP